MCLKDVELASQLARLQETGDDTTAVEPPPASPPPLLMPSARRPVGFVSPQFLSRELKELSETVLNQPQEVLQQMAEYVRSLKQLTAISAIRSEGTLQQPLPAVADDRRAWNARLERQPTFRTSRPARRPPAATVTSADLRSGCDTVAAFIADDVGRERRTSGVPYQYHTYQ